MQVVPAAGIDARLLTSTSTASQALELRPAAADNQAAVCICTKT